uniref:ANK_REP_REGION domain-containing protein n=1 Tax=Panagrellus redivivus TaxID=6233 RepID=A0A7E4VC41_PANRE
MPAPMSEVDHVLIALCNYACEKGFTNIVDDLAPHVDPVPHTLYALRRIADGDDPLLIEQATEAVVGLRSLDKKIDPPLDSTIRTALYHALLCEVFLTAIDGDLTPLHLTVYQDIIDMNFPEDYTSTDIANIDVNAKTRLALLPTAKSMIALRFFRKTEVSGLLKKHAAKLKQGLKVVVEKGFEYLHSASESTIYGVDIVNHSLWKEFAAEMNRSSDSPVSTDCADALAAFGQFLMLKKSSTSRSQLEDFDFRGTQSEFFGL